MHLIMGCCYSRISPIRVLSLIKRIQLECILTLVLVEIYLALYQYKYLQTYQLNISAKLEYHTSHSSFMKIQKNAMNT